MSAFEVTDPTTMTVEQLASVGPVIVLAIAPDGSRLEYVTAVADGRRAVAAGLMNSYSPELYHRFIGTSFFIAGGATCNCGPLHLCGEEDVECYLPR